MDDCPRCQGSLETLTLGEVSTVTCPHCEYADIPVNHDGTAPEAESWQDAFNRFYRR
ncbi:hypothetical protein D8Y22_10440 [Salinadaptatus halalkaliphilus]|uniref:Uncharacterized protein n=1 Tax=Salinadaptatus halalkaliphilus TaxID=2419781 RepID=A0A4S3TPC7_9EURY|nr:zf-TFIIB domain-containing protein [Salinadaptatus halalkaliphilus]THE65015.1 hypothetical protein D8Y22_10440 [Salinadaptatus halalkaliphilus]